VTIDDGTTIGIEHHKVLWRWSCRRSWLCKKVEKICKTTWWFEEWEGHFEKFPGSFCQNTPQ